jgi:hypothetical protein
MFPSGAAAAHCLRRFGQRRAGRAERLGEETAMSIKIQVLRASLLSGNLIGEMTDGDNQSDQHHSNFCKAIHT